MRNDARAAAFLALAFAALLAPSAPPPGTRLPFRVWVLGDSGTANYKAAAVRDAYLGYPGRDDTRALLMPGDNAIP